MAVIVWRPGGNDSTAENNPDLGDYHLRCDGDGSSRSSARRRPRRDYGTDAKGSGPDSAKLHIKPVDLTLLAKRNHGRFDPGAIYQMIDGRNARLSHHSAEMPIWGCRHQSPLPPSLPATTRRKQKIPKRIISQMKPHEDDLNSLLDLPCDSEAAIRERLLAIVSYLSLVQEK